MGSHWNATTVFHQTKPPGLRRYGKKQKLRLYFYSLAGINVSLTLLCQVPNVLSPNRSDGLLSEVSLGRQWLSRTVLGSGTLHATSRSSKLKNIKLFCCFSQSEGIALIRGKAHRRKSLINKHLVGGCDSPNSSTKMMFPCFIVCWFVAIDLFDLAACEFLPSCGRARAKRKPKSAIQEDFLDEIQTD